MNVDIRDAPLAAERGEDPIEGADLACPRRRVAVVPARRRDRVVRRGHHDDLGRFQAPRQIAEDRVEVRPIAGLVHPLDDVVHPDQERDELGFERVECRELGPDHIARCVPVHAQVGDQGKWGVPSTKPVDELLRPGVGGRPAGPDRVRVPQGHVAEIGGPPRGRPMASVAVRVAHGSSMDRDGARQSVRDTRRARPYPELAHSDGPGHLPRTVPVGRMRAKGRPERPVRRPTRSTGSSPT